MSDPTAEPRNALGGETSPYLLQHAGNPVDWMPWGEAAFAEARRRDVPIFLSVGYATCYWCHVMERESFADERVGAMLSERFVCVKVDREERPDVDEVYMTAVQLMTGQGGWPMSVWLTPGSEDGDPDGLLPFYAGTYVPPVAGYGRPSFAELIEGIGEAWRERRSDVVDQAERVGEAVRRALGEEESAAERGVTLAMMRDAAQQVARMYEPKHGGFGQAPKFPQPSWPRLLVEVQRSAAAKPSTRMDHAITGTLKAMANGGIFDQVGGGFHRYSTDAEWLVPHFEKMLYDNGQLLSLYAEAVREIDALVDAPDDAVEEVGGRWSRVMRETAEYLLREMVDETGAFWSAQDAEVDGREGLNFLWQPAEAEAALREAGEDELTGEALRLYGLDGASNFRDPHHPDAEPAWVLAMTGRTPRDGAAWARRARINAALLAVRDRRKQPRTDDKVLASWNGMAIRGLVDAGLVLNEPRYVEAAARAMLAVLKGLGTLDGGLRRSMRDGKPGKQPGFLEDYAFVIDGLLALQGAKVAGVGDAAAADWLAEAERLSDVVVDRFGSRSAGGYYDTLEGQADLLVRTKGLSDGAVASGNSQMLHNLVGLYRATGNGGYLKRAVLDARAMAGKAESAGANAAWWAAGIARLFEALPDSMGRLLAQPSAAPTDLTISVRIFEEEAAFNVVEARLVIEIPEGYALIAPRSKAAVPESLDLTPVSPEGLSATTNWPEPTSKRVGDDSFEVLEGRLEAGVLMNWHDVRPESLDEAAIFELRYQVCGNGVCFPPQRLHIEIEPPLGDGA
ncbi:MAG: thioredoxin domain-containing protein [Planctomycetota bacterium]